MADTKKTILGSTEYVTIFDQSNIPAKIDTGADSSSIHVTNLQVGKDQKLSFTLFSKKSPFYTGKVLTRDQYSVLIVRSSNGTEQIRYSTYIPITIGGRKIRVRFTLADRSRNNFPILIGRKTLTNKFLVDVSKSAIQRPPRNAKTSPLNRELKENPYKFHQKYLNRLTK